MTGVIVESVRDCEIDAAATLVVETFHTFIAPDYTEEGVATFLDFASAEGIRARLRQDGIALTARVGTDIAGFLEAREGGHICLLFTAAPHQRQGVAKALVAALLASQGWHRLTVNASPYSVPAYERLGFSATDRPQTRDGITFTPMIRVTEAPRCPADGHSPATASAGES